MALEWRVSSMNGKEETELYRDYPFDVREFTAVYFGWKCSVEDRSEIGSLLLMREGTTERHSTRIST